MSKLKLPIILTLPLLLVLSTACGPSAANLNSKEAVRKAVVQHLSTRKGLDLDMSAMDVEVGEVSFRTNEAEATVSFRPKGAQAAAMTMQYQLAREGDQWKVRPKANAAHGSGSVELPAPLPGSGGTATMPPGHPPVGAKP